MPPSSASSSLSASSSGRSPRSASSASSSSPPMERPSLMRRWMRDANVVGESREKPLVMMAQSKRSQIRSRAVLSLRSASALARRASMIGCVGLTSIVFLELMYDDMDESRRACARMMRSMLADQPYSPVTRQHGDSARRADTTTFSTLSPSTSFMRTHSASVAALASSNAFFSSSVSSIARPSFVAQMSFLPSYSLSCWTAYSSIGSTM
mmetsp:Transcript_6496/g.8751  ORF Transcript_6496/g.8751 Transcript_6496/m.8751 type:complete len:210 (-) Transcript_6496:476-1105(-)